MAGSAFAFLVIFFLPFTFVCFTLILVFFWIASGGTIAGISLGSWLGALKAKVCPSVIRF